jgi:hypothetical protein
MTRRPGAGRASLLVALALLAARPAAACTAEGCWYQHDALGPHARRATLTVRFEQVTQDLLWNGDAEADRDQSVRDMYFSGGSRHEALELYTHTRAWILDGRARVNDRLELSASLPYVQREHRHLLAHAPFYNPAFEDEWVYEGLGDAVALGHVRALGRADGASLTLQGGVKLPTGVRMVADQEKVNFGLTSMLEPPNRPGTGSTDWIAGALAAQPLPWRGLQPLTASAAYRWNGTGAEGYRAGDQFQAGLGLGHAPAPWLTLLLQANYIGNAADAPGDPEMGAHPAQRALWLTPGATVRVASRLSVYALLQSRVWGRTEGRHVVGQSQWLLGTAFTPGP